MPTPPGGAVYTTFQLGTYNSVTDTFTSVLDLNDRTNFWMEQGGLKLDQPEKVYVRNFNFRTRGEKLSSVQYKNRHVQVSLRTQGASTAALMTNLRNLLAIVENPPFVIRIALPGATQYSYADVVGVTHNIPIDTMTLLAKALKGIQIDFECNPGLRGDRLSLQNLVINPGASAPSGTGVPYFSDSFANFNAYAIQAGGALAQDTATFVEAALTNGPPTRYYRCDETSGTVAHDAMASGSNITWTGSPTVGATGLLTGDTDKAVTLNGSSQYGTAAISGMPNGSAAWTIWALINPSALPASNQIIAYFGNWGGSSGYAQLGINSSKTVFGGVGSGGANPNPSTVLSTGSVYFVAVSYQGGAGGNVTTYVQKSGGSMVSAASSTTANLPSSATANIVGIGAGSVGSGQTAANYFAGTVDEVGFAAVGMNATQIQALATQAFTSPASAAGTMVVPAGGRVSFGSPAWSGANPWQVPFRWLTGGTLQAYLHYTDANNYLLCQMQSSTLVIYNVVGGVSTTVASNGSVALVNGMQYILQVTQFPTNPPTNSHDSTFPAWVQASLYANNNGSPGNLVTTIGAAFTSDVYTYPIGTNSTLNGRPQIAASGTGLGLGGVATAHSWAGWGPGGWAFSNTGAGTGLAAGAWEQQLSKCYSGGPVQSVGAGRIDAAPAGTLAAQWLSGTAGSAAAIAASGIPATQGQVLGVQGQVNGSGLSGTAVVALKILEYNSSGTLLTTGTVVSSTGAFSIYTQLAGTYTIANASTAFALLAVTFTDTTSNSANGTIWWDNLLVWNQTTTGQTSMPYCEMVFPQSPAQIIVSGLLGDIPAPAALAFGTFFSSFATGSVLNFWFGRRALASATAQLVAAALTVSSAYAGVAPIIDTTAYGGMSIQQTGTGFNVRPVVPLHDVADMTGVYHLLTRFKTAESGSNLANVIARLDGFEAPLANGANALNTADSVYYTAYAQLATAANTWTASDVGQLPIPLAPAGALRDPTAVNAFQVLELYDNNGGGAQMNVNWVMLLPVDGDVLLGVVNNPSNAYSLTNSWLWVYSDGLVAYMPAWLRSVETSMQPNEGHAMGGVGSTSSGYLNILPTGDGNLMLDPSQVVNGTGVNQIAGLLADGNGAVLGIATQLQYSPLYLFPR